MQTHLALLPGLNNTAALWDEVARQLAPIAQTHADTSPPLDNVEDIASHWLDKLPEHFYLCGTSFGGYVAMAMLELAPERILGLALVCTNPGADTEAQVAARQKAIATAEAGDYEAIIAAQIAVAVHPDRLTDASLLAARAAMVHEYGKQRYMAHLKAAIARPDRTGLLTGFSGKKVLVAAAQDKLFPPEAMTALAQATNTPLQIVEGSGHLLALEQPLPLATVLSSWLGEARKVVP